MDARGGTVTEKEQQTDRSGTTSDGLASVAIVLLAAALIAFLIVQIV